MCMCMFVCVGKFVCECVGECVGVCVCVFIRFLIISMLFTDVCENKFYTLYLR